MGCLLKVRIHTLSKTIHVDCPNPYFELNIYICLWTKKIFELYFNDRLTVSNIRSRTSRRIYRLALLLRAPEMLPR